MEDVEQVEPEQATASAYRRRQRQRNRDAADVIAELGRWDGTTLSDEAWDAELGVVREGEA